MESGSLRPAYVEERGWEPSSSSSSHCITYGTCLALPWSLEGGKASFLPSLHYKGNTASSSQLFFLLVSPLAERQKLKSRDTLKHVTAFPDSNPESID